METRSNHILVGAVVLALLAAVIGFTAWISGRGGGSTKEFDIFFRQSVSGLDKGGSVSFAGVPVGQVKDIELWLENPEFVRVRIAVKEAVPILIGTTAAVQSLGFTGGSQIVLSGAVKGAPAISELGPEGVPTIPSRTAGLGALLNNAPQLVERLSTLTERLTEVLSDKNQAALGNILSNTDKFSSSLAKSGPQLDATLIEAKTAVREAGIAARQMSLMAGNAAALVNQEGRPMMAELRTAVIGAQRSMANLDSAIADTRPGLKALSSQTLPEIGQLVRDLRATSDALGSVATKIDQQGIGTLIGGPKLPDYVPAKEKN
jgi:phospholipid/cholesterol/gamma-HCH transport system substrate-binding protein